MYYPSMRNSGERRDGGSFSPEEVQAVWNKGRIIPNYDPGFYRWDACGAVIQRDRHGDTGHPYGWEVDHIRPLALGGGDYLENLQPLQWENNRKKGDSPVLVCARP